MQKNNTNKSQLLIILLIFVIAFTSRLILLELRPLHHDESVNEYFLSNLINNNNYKYNPDNYHGPFLYYITLPFTFLKTTELTLRLPEVLFGSILCMLPFLIKTLSKKAKIISSIFLMLSPSLFYYSRYAIHEIFFTFFTFLAIVSLINLSTKKSKKIWIYGLIISLFLAYSNKETAIINGFCVIIVLILMLLSKERRKNIITNLTCERKNKLIPSKHILFALILAIFIHIILFSSFFSNPNGILDSIIGPFNWKTRTNEHAKPFYYFVEILFKFELPILILSLGSVFYYAQQLIKDKNKQSGLYITIFAFLLLISYSLISYKTPWLIISFVSILSLSSGILLSKIPTKKIFLILCSLSIVFLIFQTIMTSFINPANDKNNPFSYVHTDINLKQNIQFITQNNIKLEIVGESADYWPLPYYLKENIIAYSDITSFNNSLETNKQKNILIREQDFESIKNYIHQNYTILQNKSIKIRSGSTYIFLELNQS